MTVRSRYPVAREFVAVLLAALVFLITAFAPWHAELLVRRATAVVLATLTLWITEAAPLGITGLLIPVAATLAGVLTWTESLAAWGDPILFLFLGAFLLARALDKHGAFEFLIRARWAQRLRGGHGAGLAAGVMLVAGLVSTVQSNTAVAAMMLPAVVALARTVRNPPLVLLALSYGATFGGMATPVGTPPNFIGYGAMRKLDPTMNFLTWLGVGLPVWAGTCVLAWALVAAARFCGRGTGRGAAAIARAPGPADTALPEWDGETGICPQTPPTAVQPDADATRRAATRRTARRVAVAAFALTVLIWLATGLIASVTQPTDPLQAWVRRYWPESLAPVLTAGVLFMVRVGPQREPVLDRHDFRVLDWDTLFLIAGGLCLGTMLQVSGAAAALGAAVGSTSLPPLVLMFGLGGITVLLSELTSNTATAALMVPIAASLAPAVGMAPVQTIWLVALCASLGFALPVSTPPNAIVYGTRLVPLRTMAALGIVLDVLSLIWVVACVRWLA
ncbi:MAG: SLC13 family permease [Candidatus Latescibacterota bacterium]